MRHSWAQLRGNGLHFNCVRILPLHTIICPLEPADWKFARYCQLHVGSDLAGKEYVRRISETTSTYLNVLRFLTATGVVLFHFRDKDFGPAWLTGFFPSQGQSFVVVFFVLSGFFVTMLAEQKSLGEFALDRMIRIYIVALPILIFTSVLSAVAPSISTTDEYEFALQHPAATFFLNLSFLSQSWWLHVLPFVDGPYWSLPFEVFYYFIFASFTYARGWRRWVLLAAIFLIAGPKILLRFPCWIVGAVAYKYRGASTNGWAWAILAPIVLFAGFRFGLKDASNHLNDYLLFEGDATLRGLFPEGFIRNWFVAGAFAVHIWGVCSIKQNFPAIVRDGQTKWLACLIRFTCCICRCCIFWVQLRCRISARWHSASLRCRRYILVAICFRFAPKPSAERSSNDFE